MAKISGLCGKTEYVMAGRIKIDAERCKGCGLCVVVCPKENIVLSKKLNKSGYFPACLAPIARTRSVSAGITKRNVIDSSIGAGAECTGCCFCALICPDAAIEVFCEDKVVAAKSKKGMPKLIKERA